MFAMILRAVAEAEKHLALEEPRRRCNKESDKKKQLKNESTHRGATCE